MRKLADTDTNLYLFGSNYVSDPDAAPPPHPGPSSDFGAKFTDL